MKFRYLFVIVIVLLLIGCVEKAKDIDTDIITIINDSDNIDTIAMPSHTKTLYYDSGYDNKQVAIDEGLAVKYNIEGDGFITNVSLYATRYSNFVKDFDIEIWDANLNTVYSITRRHDDYFPLSTDPKNLNLKWVNIDIPYIKLTNEFYVVFFSHSGGGPHRCCGWVDGGIYLGQSIRKEGVQNRSYIATKNPNNLTNLYRGKPKLERDLMIRTTIDSSPPISAPKIEEIKYHWEMNSYGNEEGDYLYLLTFDNKGNIDLYNVMFRFEFYTASGKFYTERKFGIGDVKSGQTVKKNIRIPLRYWGRESWSIQKIFISINNGPWKESRSEKYE